MTLWPIRSSSERVCRKTRSSVGPSGRCHSAGFTVLEVLVAVTILAVGMIPLLALQQRSIGAVAAVERAQARARMDQTVLAYIEGVNMARRPGGEARIDGATVRWQARPVSDARAVTTLTGAAGRFRLTLFRVEVTVSPADSGSRRWTVDQLGWQPTNPFQ